MRIGSDSGDGFMRGIVLLRGFVIGQKCEQLVQPLGPGNLAATLIPLNIRSTIIEEIDFPILAGSIRNDSYGIVAIGRERVWNPSFAEPGEKLNQIIEAVWCHLLNLPSVSSLWNV